MPSFVKLDTGILVSTLWNDRDTRDVFLTALLMAEPWETTEELEQLEVDSLQATGWKVPPGWYGFVAAAGSGIVHRSLVGDQARGIAALRALGSPDIESRTPDHEGRRLVRVDGGYVVLNYVRYRDRDYTAAERSRRWRERKKKEAGATQPRRDGVTTHRDDTQAEAYLSEGVRKKRSAREQQNGVTPLRQALLDMKVFWLSPKKLTAMVAKLEAEGISVELLVALANEVGGDPKKRPGRLAALLSDDERRLHAFKELRRRGASEPAGLSTTHIPNMPLGTASCGCPGCVAYRANHR